MGQLSDNRRAFEADGAWMTNEYACPCGAEWSDEWSCEADDDCPACGTTCSPSASTDAEPPVSGWVLWSEGGHQSTYTTRAEAEDAAAAMTPPVDDFNRWPDDTAPGGLIWTAESATGEAFYLEPLE